MTKELFSEYLAQHAMANGTWLEDNLSDDLEKNKSDIISLFAYDYNKSYKQHGGNSMIAYKEDNLKKAEAEYKSRASVWKVGDFIYDKISAICSLFTDSPTFSQFYKIYEEFGDYADEISRQCQ
jgi:hypothetical protein